MHNRIFDDIHIGDATSLTRTLTLEDIQALALLSGYSGPECAGAAGAAISAFAPGMWAGTLVSAALGSHLPGPGAALVGQSFRYFAPLAAGDTLTLRIEVTSRDPETRRIGLRCEGNAAGGARVLTGDIEMTAPSESLHWTRSSLPGMRPDGQGVGNRRLLDLARTCDRVRVAVVHPCDEVSLTSALEARRIGLIEPVLIAPRARLEAVAAAARVDLAGIAIEDAPHSHGAAALAVQFAASGKVEALMKGSLHTDELMGAVVAANGGLRTKRRITHCFVMHTPAYPRPFIITDAAVNIAPTLAEKVDIVQNAIDLAHVLGVAEPRVAILAAVETVTLGMPATLDAAALCKMADRGQITGAVLDGPLAFDNAVSVAAAQIKGIKSPVAGRADILVVPDLESGNMLAKQLEYLGDADMAGIALGAKTPIVLTSRADALDTRLASCAIAVLLAHHYRASPP